MPPSPDDFDRHATFIAWLEVGVECGWITPPVCAQHDGLPMTGEEADSYEEGYDPCVFVVRVWGPDGPPPMPEPPPWANAHMN